MLCPKCNRRYVHERCYNCQPVAKQDAAEVIDESSPANNMYGCSPCPNCASRYRWPDQNNVLRCDDCGYLSQWKR